MIRKILSVVTGAALFCALVGTSIGIFIMFGITPIGQSVQSALKDRTLDGFIKFMVSDEGFHVMSQGFSFTGLAVLPFAAVFAGCLTSYIARTRGWLWSIVAVLPCVVFLIGYSSFVSIFSVILCVLAAALGGYLVNYYTGKDKTGQTVSYR